MRRTKNLFIFLFLSYATIAQQQAGLSENDYLLRYKKAVQLYADQKYFEAKELLLPLTNKNYNNSIAPYAHYYYALAAFKLNKFYDARTILKQLLERFPDWRKMEDATYLYANVAFAENKPEEALQSLNRITSKAWRQDIENMEYLYLSKIKELSQLKNLYQKSPDNPVLAQLIVDHIQRNKNANREDLELSDQLTNQFNLGGNSGNNSRKSRNKDNDNAINVAVMLPFRLFEFDPNRTNRPNQYVYDLYAGMKLAQEKLASEQINLNLYAFDIERDVKHTSDVVGNRAFDKVDLIIGPLYPEVNKIANSFVKSNDAVQVHPLSNNLQLVNNEKSVFLATPSYEIQASKAIEYIVNEKRARSVAIYYGNTRKDSTFAYIYRDKALEKGLKVFAIRKYNNADNIDTKQKPDHVFISGSESNLGPKIITALDKKRINAPIVAISSAFDFEGSSLSIFNRDLYVIQLDYMDREKEEVKNFRSAYINSQNIAPSYYGYLGYDMLLFYGRMLKSGKNRLRSNLDSIEYTQGYTLDGFDYTNRSNENKIVPIIKYQDGKFIEVAR
jgi:ABC-type branched-subunit amino acid transport system substrate-binding protein/predicted negative regulator of RcsB-dependent stress response